MSLQEMASPSEAISLLVGCEASDRTTTIWFYNNTPAEIVIWFVKCIDDSGLVPPGYLTDTRTFIGVANVPPYRRVDVDPCPVCQKFKPIQATYIESVAKLRHNGRKWDEPLNLRADPGTFMGTAELEFTAKMLAERFPEFDGNATQLRPKAKG